MSFQMGALTVYRRQFLKSALASAWAGALFSTHARAQSYPDRPIRLIVPFAPGGVYDAVGRPWADKAKSALGTVVVENVGGAGGSLGAAQAARATPDGYTILLGGSGPLVINPVATTHPPYDPIKDFEPISTLVATGLAFVVNPKMPIHSLKELITYAKANPGKLSYGSAGAGTMNHLTGELFKSLAGVDIIHVPYKGAGPALTDLIAGQIPLATPNVTGQVLELARSGQLRILAVTSPHRIAGATNIPTAVEAGLPGMVSQNFVGLYAPAGTDKAIVEKLSSASAAVMANADLKRILVAAGMESIPANTPAQARQYLADEISRWTPVIQSIGLRLDSGR
jgi:tripartite-type tricarboxylate transporter receptor subunit TctC